MFLGAIVLQAGALFLLAQARGSAAYDVRVVRADVQRRLAAAIARALAPTPSARHESIEAMARALAPADPVTVRSVQWMAMGTVAAAVIALTATRIGRHTAPAQPAAVIQQSAGPTAQAQLVAPAVLQTPATDPQAASSEPGLSFKSRDWALITAFENHTGEAILDGTLEFALERELSNSSFVNIVPRERIDDVLRLMVKPVDAKIDWQLGREICLRDGGIRALITGRVDKIGATYVLSSQIVNPQDGVVARSLTEEAASQADLLPALRREGLRVREALGEMLSTIRSSEAALEQVTTPSLHALQLYSQAAAFLKGDWGEWKDEPAEQLLRQAISEDDSFASAYILLAYTVKHLRHPDEEVLGYASRAFQLASHASDVERYFIIGSYYGFQAQRSPGTEAEHEVNLRKAMTAYQALLRIKPDHFWGSGNLFFAYEELRQEPQATNALIHLAEIRPTSVDFQLRVGLRLIARREMNRVPVVLRRLHALVTPDVARRSPRDKAFVQLLEAWDAWARYDVRRVRRIADDLLRGEAADDATFAVVAQPLTSIYIGLGRLSDYRRLLVPRLPPQDRNPALLPALLQEIELGKPGALDTLRDFMASNYSDLKSVPFNIVLAFALVELGRFDDALTFTADQKVFLALIEAYKAIAKGRVQDGIRAFDAANQLLPAPNAFEMLEARAVAQGWKREGRLQTAIDVLEKATENRWPRVLAAGQNSVATWIQALELLADLYRETGRSKEAAAVDRQLVKLLAEADPDYPPLVRLKHRYAQ